MAIHVDLSIRALWMAVRIFFVYERYYNIFVHDHRQGLSECEDVCDAKSLDFDLRNMFCYIVAFDCFVTEENVIWSKHLE